MLLPKTFSMCKHALLYILACCTIGIWVSSEEIPGAFVLCVDDLMQSAVGEDLNI